MTCRYATKRTFPTRREARAGAETIRATVEARGGTYQTLYPYGCPDGEHWHLSHYPQGYATCGWCQGRVPAWNGGYWVVGAHDVDGQPCQGTGSQAVT